MRAYQLLADCRRAHELLETETDAQVVRIVFVAAFTLCRAVGHVLHKVDAQVRPELVDRIEEWWREVKSNQNDNAIFHEFIEQQRNSVLKQYEFTHDDADQNVVVQPTCETFTLNDLLFCPISEGRYAGEDCRDLLEQAILWWESQLHGIETGEPQQDAWTATNQPRGRG